MSPLAVVALLGVLITGSQPSEGADHAYCQGRFEEALSQYRSELAGPESSPGPVLFAMGNCAYRLERYAEAVLYYRKALLRLPRDLELRSNLRLAEGKLGLAEPAGHSIGSRWRSWMAWLTPLELLVLAAGLQALGLGGWVLFRRRRGVRLALVLVALVGLAGAVHLLHAQLLAPPAGVVLPRAIVVRQDPHPALPTLLELRAGEPVKVLELSDRWARVAHPRGVGWTERDGIGVVD